MQKTEVLNTALLNSKNHTEVQDSANYYKDTVLTAMQELRALWPDELETLRAPTGRIRPSAICCSACERPEPALL